MFSTKNNSLTIPEESILKIPSVILGILYNTRDPVLFTLGILYYTWDPVVHYESCSTKGIL